MSEQTNFQPDAETQELFRQALQKNQKEREEKDLKKKGGFFANYEQIEWCGLENKKDVVGRLIGRPIELRKNSTDPNFVYFSKLLNDNGTSYSEIRWKVKEDGSIDENWILAELYLAITKREWVKYTDGHKNDKGYDGEYHYVHKDKPSFIRLMQNRRKDASAKFISPKAKYAKRLLVNWLDRMDNWCKENKHYKLLSSKKNLWKDDDNGNPIYISDFGVPEMVYTRIMDNVIAYRDSWDLDIIITKNYNPNDLANAYIVKDIFEDKISKEAKEIGKYDPLTEEEKSYVAYNIDNLCKPTSYQKLLKNFIGLFTYADADTGMKYDFVNRLKKLAEEEAKENAANKKEDIVEVETDIKEENIIEVNTKAEVPVETVEVKVETATRQSSASKSIEDLCKENFPKWESVPKSEQQEFLDQIERFEGKVPIYKKPNEALPCMDAKCKFVDSDIRTVFPNSIFNCPICGIKDTSSATK